MYRKPAVVVVCAALAACSSPTAPAVCDVSHPTPIFLTVGAYASFDVCAVSFPANASADSAEYLIVAQSAGGKPGGTATYQLRSTTAATAAVVGPTAAAAAPMFRPEGGGALAAQFDRYLRNLEQQNAPLPPGSLPGAATSAVNCAPKGLIPVVGGTRTFCHVCSNLGCTTWDTVTAVVKAVSGHFAIYVDPARPGDLAQADLDSLAAVFDQHAYAVDTAAFGRVQDADQNGVVIALLTGLVNGLSNPATCFTTGYVAGYFFSPDLDLQVGNTYNAGEIMYGLVADQSGTYGCAHTIPAVKRLLPATFVHELQHMINYTQHVRVRRTNSEDTWLNEALSKYAEELSGRSFLPDSAAFNRYTLDDLNDAYLYLQSPESHFLLSEADQDLADYGSGWLFMRYLVDQLGDSLPYRLVNTSLTGTSNISTQSGIPFETLVALWAMANWASDLQLSGFAAPPEIQYKSWNWRQAFAALQAQDTTGRYPRAFPLAPAVSGGAQVNVAGTLRGGSGLYVRAMQAPAASTFTLTFTGPSGTLLPTTIKPRLVVLRLR